MKKENERYHIEGANFDSVYNRNEYVVREELKKLIDTMDYVFSDKDIQDIYALTLNETSPHYVHNGTIVLFPNVQKQEIKKRLLKNILLVQDRPKV